MMSESTGRTVWLNKRQNCLQVKGVTWEVASPTSLGLVGFVTTVEGFKQGNSRTQIILPPECSCCVSRRQRRVVESFTSQVEFPELESELFNYLGYYLNYLQEISNKGQGT